MDVSDKGCRENAIASRLQALGNWVLLFYNWVIAVTPADVVFCSPYICFA